MLMKAIAMYCYEKVGNKGNGMEIKWLRVLVTEIFKKVNNLNPNYMKDIFTPKLHPKVRPNDQM